MTRHYTLISPEDLWKHFPSGRVFKGGGNQSEAKMVSSKGLRLVDFDIVRDSETGVETVLPNPKKGLSMSTSVERLARLKIEGVVWELVFPDTLPAGLVVNFDAPDHPLINVAQPTPVPMVIHLLTALGRSMKNTGVRITSKGQVVSK